MLAILAISTLFASPGLFTPASAFVTANFSWNPRVGCTPLVVRITDITQNQTQQASFSASPFSPGITTSVTGGDAKRWLTSGPTPSGWNSPGPACTVTNSLGTTSVFVQINGIERSSLTTEDWSTLYDPVNGGTAHSSLTGDTTFNLFDPAAVPNYSNSCATATDPTCYGRIHAEIDHDWKAAGYCGTGTVCDNATLASQTSATSTMIDVQGFVYWDPGNLNATWHQFNGWEIHPLTAWKLSSTPPPVPFSVSVSPNTPQVGGTVSFSATPSNGTMASSFSWDFGDGVSAAGSSVSHMYVSAQAFTAYVTMTDNLGNSYTTWRTIPVGSWNSAVLCSPVITTLEGVLGSVTIDRIPLNSSTAGADYSGGGFQLDGSLGYGANPSTWPFFRRDLQPPCSVNGTSAFVEFHNVTVINVSVDNCGTTYSNGTSYPHGWQSCDTTFSLVTPGWGDDGTCPACYLHRIYAGIDRDWNASSIAPMPPPLEGQRIDVQGFVFWNNDAVNANWHSYTGWELHPIAAWETTKPSISAGFSVSPSNPATGQTVSFTGTASGGTAPYSFSWDFGDGTAGTGNPASHIYASGTFSIHMAATDSNGVVGVSSQTITVTSPFTIAASQPSLIIQAGKSNSTTITVTSLNGFLGNVTLSSTVGPVGPTVSLNPSTVTLSPNGSASSLLTVSVGSNVPPGTYTVSVTGVSESFQQTIQVSIAVTMAGSPTFVLQANPASLVLLAGSKGTDNVTAASVNGFTGTVKLVVSGAPSGVKLALNPTSLSLTAGGTPHSVLTVTTATNSIAGNYTLTITGTSGTTTKKLALALTITSGFTMSASATSLTLVSGTSKSATINLKSLGLQGTITLSTSVSSSNLTATISPSSLSFTPGQTKSSTLTVTSKTAGAYSVTVIATSGTIVHTLTIPITIADFTLSASPSTLTVARGSTGTSSISLTSLYGFTGTVKLADTVSPTGLKATLSTTSISLLSGGTSTATLTFSPATTTPTGSYTITVTATSGSLVHKFTIVVMVTA